MEWMGFLKNKIHEMDLKQIKKRTKNKQKREIIREGKKRHYKEN